MEHIDSALDLVARGAGDTVVSGAVAAGRNFPAGLHTVPFAEPLHDVIALVQRSGVVLSPATASSHGWRGGCCSNGDRSVEGGAYRAGTTRPGTRRKRDHHVRNHARRPDDDQRHVAELLGDAEVAMLTTMTEDGRHVSRPMAIQEAEFDGDLWFFAYDDSAKRPDRRAPRGERLVSPTRGALVDVARARASVVHDRQKAEQLWAKPPAGRGSGPDSDAVGSGRDGVKARGGGGGSR